MVIPLCPKQDYTDFSGRLPTTISVFCTIKNRTLLHEKQQTRRFAYLPLSCRQHYRFCTIPVTCRTGAYRQYRHYCTHKQRSRTHSQLVDGTTGFFPPESAYRLFGTTRLEIVFGLNRVPRHMRRNDDMGRRTQRTVHRQGNCII